MKYQPEIMHAARYFVSRFGADAPREAMVRADELGRVGDMEGRDLWSLIAAATRELAPPPTDRQRAKHGNGG